MLLPFVREIFADAQKSAPFARLLARLKDQQPPSGEGAGRISVSGLNPTATLLHLALLHGALRTPLTVRYAEHYSGLAVTVRREESLDVEVLTAHLGTVGYAATDVVEMPGEYALRGGILDVFSPEAERPVRIELFGDEVESIRSFDPHS